MSMQQLKKELENLKQKINTRNEQAEYLLSNAREEVKREIDRISERLRERGEVCVLSGSDKEELFKKIRASCEERVKDPYFQRWVRGF